MISDNIIIIVCFPYTICLSFLLLFSATMIRNNIWKKEGGFFFFFCNFWSTHFDISSYSNITSTNQNQLCTIGVGAGLLFVFLLFKKRDKSDIITIVSISSFVLLSCQCTTKSTSLYAFQWQKNVWVESVSLFFFILYIQYLAISSIECSRKRDLISFYKTRHPKLTLWYNSENTCSTRFVCCINTSAHRFTHSF
jgi:hypothetical protein